MRKRYLFIRILEACNANCFMCDFALSKDPYRFSRSDLDALLPIAVAADVGYVRFTGGEPLLHRDIEYFVEGCSRARLKPSIITNGARLARQIGRLADAGLEQIIVSIDGLERSHDEFRRTPDLFAKCMEGLKAARRLNVRTRVNTVVGPHNYREMRDLQRILTEAGVEQWELSALKLGRRIAYDDPQDVVAACEPIYSPAENGLLVPMGRRFYGETEEQRALFFEAGIAPRALAPRCNLIGDVIYLDPKANRAFGCSLLPHRAAEESLGGVPARSRGWWNFDTAEWRSHVAYFQARGPETCTGCSATAAGYSDAVARHEELTDWAF